MIIGECLSWAVWDGHRVDCGLAAGHTTHDERHAAEVGEGRKVKLVTWRESGERATSLGVRESRA